LEMALRLFCGGNAGQWGVEIRKVGSEIKNGAQDLGRGKKSRTKKKTR